MFGISKILLFLKEYLFCSSRLNLFDQKYKKRRMLKTAEEIQEKDKGHYFN